MPTNIQETNKTRKVIAWAYWIGVGEEANKAWQKNTKTIQSAIKVGATYFTTPLGALAIGAIIDLFTPTLGEDVYYAICNQTNRDLFLVSHAQTLAPDTSTFLFAGNSR